MGKQLVIKGADFRVNSIETETLEFTYFGSNDPTTNRKPLLVKDGINYFLENRTADSTALDWKLKYIDLSSYVGIAISIVRNSGPVRVMVSNIIPSKLQNTAEGYEGFDTVGYGTNNRMQIATDRVNTFETLASTAEYDRIRFILNGEFVNTDKHGVYLLVNYVNGQEPSVEFG